ncbi:MAG TPA: UbiD family decarboxylase [Candidatus Acidoferrales bacterium]|nr:UbiD family decarboxylase [Candidatus Acidoferrales bacterium]
MAYADLREYLSVLEKKGKLKRVKKQVDKDWELAAVCRQLFHKIAPEKRPALLFENVKGFSIPVAAGVLGASKQIYALGLETDSVEGINRKWDEALGNPIPPRMVKTGPCKENVLHGEQVNISKLPVPVWTVGEDPGPFFTSPYVITKDPETGNRNVGTYRMQVKGPNKTGFLIGVRQDAAWHIRRNNELNKPTPVAVVIGADPSIGYVSVSKMSDALDEFAVAGALRGEPVDLVPCETVPLEVPATAEIVLEGEIPANTLEPEGPFGEYTGYMGPAGDQPFFKIKCMTFRNNPIYQAFISQMPPSESSCIRGVGREWPLFKHLKHVLRLPIKDLRLKEAGGSGAYCVVSLNKQFEGQVRQLMYGIWSMRTGFGKITVVVDDDIDVWDDFAVDWALSWRVRPDRDVYIERDVQAVGLDPSQAPPSVPQHAPIRQVTSRIAIDATRKHEYPAVSLPPKEHLDLVASRWKEYGIED